MVTNIFQVTSPVMGIYYGAPEPGAEAFIRVGMHVQSGDVVCVIESMKIFTQIRTDKPGLVKKILVENEAMVTKNQALIEIEIKE